VIPPLRIIMKRTWEILSAVSVVVGLACLFFAFFLPKEGLIFAITLALGVSFLPAGLIAIITAVASSKVIEDNLKIELSKSRSTLTEAISSLVDASRAIEENLAEKVEETTGDLKASIGELRVATTYLNRPKELGLVMVYENRSQALDPFLTHLQDYVQRATDGEVVFVGSSLKGVIEDEPKYAGQLERILKLAKDRCECRFLLTHPFYSKFREDQEESPPGGIAIEILHAIAWLEQRGVSPKNIKVYKGTPTCFMIASREKMLINPYPYQKQAFRSFCLELENVLNGKSIYDSFWTNHYHKPWYGVEERRDHIARPNALYYLHEALERPLPHKEMGEDKLLSYADFFVINDTGSFYLAVNVRSLESQIIYNRRPDGSCSVVKVGDKLQIRLLDLSEASGDEVWQTIGDITLSPTRDGFWHTTIEGHKSFGAYSMIAVFDPANPSPFTFERANPRLQGKQLPLLWKWLVPTERKLQGSESPRIPIQEQK
jgi:hypothetical protein